ncbi:hypothetical protein SVIOM342S_06727 [Streptomyces violaceorubidus]
MAVSVESSFAVPGAGQGLPRTGTSSSALTGPGGVPSPNGAPAQLLPVVGREPAGPIRAHGHDAGRVDAGVHLVVVALDVVEVDGVPEPGRLEEITDVGPQHRVLRQLPAVALEVAVVDGVEADQGREQPDLRLRDRVPDQVALPLQPGRQLLQASEHTRARGLVLLLAGGEARPVHAVVDVLVDPGHHLVDLVAQGPRIQVGCARPVQGGPLRREVEGDLLVVVGDEGPAGHVHHRGHAPPARVAGLPPVVGLAEVADAEDRVAAVPGPA